jgi:transposase
VPKYVCIISHLSGAELATRYRKAADLVERSHFHIIWLLSLGKRVREVSEVTGYCANWIRILARRYNLRGPEALVDQRQHNRGTTPLLSQGQQEQLEQVLEQSAADSGLWTGRKVALWMGEQTGRKVHPQRGWDYLIRLGFSLQIPRPRHHKADKDKQEAFKHQLPEMVRQIQHEHSQAQVELWCMDEHRAGLRPVLRRIWAQKGHRPVVRVQQRYEWLYVYSFVHPESGNTQWLLLPFVNVDVFSLALEHFAQAVGACANKRIILVLDRAGWHTSQALTIPEGIHLLFLPAYSPELQPAEHLWPLTNEALANRRFETLDELQEVQAQRCVVLQDDPAQVHAVADFHWWPKLAS